MTLPRLVIAEKLGKAVLADRSFAPVAGMAEPKIHGRNNRRDYGLGLALTNSLRYLFTQPIILFTGILNGVANGVLLLFVTGLVTDYLSLKHLT